MAIPAYDQFYREFLELLSDGKERHISEIVNLLGQKLHLSEADLAENFKNGTFKFKDRVGWAKTYLKKAVLIESPSRGRNRITQRGLEALNNTSTEINNKYLKQFPEFIEFIGGKKIDELNEVETAMNDRFQDKTPQELLELSFFQINNSLAQELLEQIKQSSPRFFEKSVLKLLIAMGYGNSNMDFAEVTQYTNDKGIDGIIKEDSLGLDKIYIQAKRWTEGTVGRKELQEFVGALAGKRSKKGVFITTSKFADTATRYVESDLGIDTKVVLIDGLKLADLMIKFNVGVFVKDTFEIKRIDSDFFDEEDF
ncbi:MAG: restriction endonuclease [Candidatus Melainabacteria bacterium]|jgi:restriction system protein